MRSILIFFKDIKVSHTLFALPFAASSIFFLSVEKVSFPSAIKLIFAMFFARSFAMGMNRYLDRDIDAENPRTRLRAIPSGILAPSVALCLSVFSGLCFIGVCWFINLTTFALSVPLLVFLGLYPLMKRTSILTHFYLGICLGLSPIAVAIALEASLSPALICVAAAVALWTAGFDLIYALQDISFDRKERLFSIPAAFGMHASAWISRICFMSMVALLISAGIIAHRGVIYFTGVGFIAFFLFVEHALVRGFELPGFLGRLNFAFFEMNVFVSIVFFLACLGDSLS